MNFPNKFKIWWWAGLLMILTIIGGWRFHVGTFNAFDIFIFVFWFILVLFPIISEINIGGISVKKDIEDAKKEIKEQIGEIKNEIRNHINFNPIINVHTEKAKENEIEEKLKNEIRKEGNVDVSVESYKKGKIISTSEKVQNRINELRKVEDLVNKILVERFGENYRAQIKIINSLGKKFIADGAVFEDNKIREIVEIKFITSKSIEAFKYIAGRYVNKIVELGIKRSAVRFVLVSKDMNQEFAQNIKIQMVFNEFIKNVFEHALPTINTEFYKFWK
ncbi:MAG: hypothetical protein UT03_C0053G0006 [Candidatus Moranbacteria bacterium GW2011_GWD2_38_7]|nr:MAG: hypothetical protein UT03_C0053G0006 [Candidatus Moranbacteria bacterium GW2011_GWD2_38_7]